MTSLIIDNLHKSYGDLKALDGVSFAVSNGEIFGFVGGNGAGKTTTMRIILGVLAANSGDVLWNDHPISLEDRRRIGYMPSERGLYPAMTVRDQLVYFARLKGVSAKAAAQAAVRWTERLNLAHRLDDKLQALSLGNQQRAQLAAALIADPEILVLDEPFSGLDPIAVDVMSEVLREAAASGVPVIFSSHQLALVETLCDRVGIIEQGKMVAVGSVEALATPEHPRFEVYGAPPEAWMGSLPDAHILEQAPSTTPGSTSIRTVLEIPGGDGQAVLAAALGAGPVTSFRPSRPTLTDLYRHVVSDKEATE
ncbi:MAG: ATP-binding cassette domain-containing protein [Promicromonosporaceae bacterium]|nr:ATP-binding cassette domain-containing protein [Promicromonosporaceae bacterium]